MLNPIDVVYQQKIIKKADAHGADHFRLFKLHHGMIF